MVAIHSSVNDSEMALLERHRKSLLTRRVLLVLLLIVAYIAVNYTVAWFDAYRLGKRVMLDADAAYAHGNYLDALDGYEERDAVSGKAVSRRGYTQVVRLWGDEYAWPLPQTLISQAQGRVDEIIQERLTIADAESFIQANTGVYNPYFGDVFLRLGELYEEAGDKAGALSIYRDAVELLTDRPDIIEKARIHLNRLENEL